MYYWMLYGAGVIISFLLWVKMAKNYSIYDITVLDLIKVFCGCLVFPMSIIMSLLDNNSILYGFLDSRVVFLSKRVNHQ